MKKSITMLVTLAMALTMQVSAGAAYIPDDVTYQNLDGQQLAIKVYTLLPEQDPTELREPAFDHDGYHYEISDVVKEENHFDEQNIHTETVTVNTASKSLSEVLKKLEPTMEYDDGTWSGKLALDHSTIHTEAAGYRKSSYSVTATKTYTGLDRNDSSYIAPTVMKNGRTLSLSNVTWSVESTALVGDDLVPATYSAVATYSGLANSTIATGYVTTADYIGTVTSSGISSIQYTVTYLGTKTDFLAGLSDGNAMIIAVPAAFAVLMLGLLGYWLLLRSNTTIYQEAEKENEYEKCGRLRVKVKDPELKLDRLKNAPSGRIAVEIEEKTARKLFGKSLKILNHDESFTHTVGHADGNYWFKADLAGKPEDEKEESL